jgi:4-hydroxybenzoate polyprenyltransferase
MLGFASLLPVVIYPFMKRITSWPQAVLGLAFSWGALMGWAAEFGSLSFAPLMLYVGAIFWTMGYDTIYAVQDIEDDAIAGIRSTARLFGVKTRLAVFILYAFAFVAITLSFVSVQIGIVGMIGLAMFGAHLARQVVRIDLADGQTALKLFRSNRDAGLILFGAVLIDGLVKTLL